MCHLDGCFRRVCFRIQTRCSGALLLRRTAVIEAYMRHIWASFLRSYSPSLLGSCRWTRMMDSSLGRRYPLSLPAALVLTFLSIVPAIVAASRPEDALIVVGSTPLDDTGLPVSPGRCRRGLNNALCIAGPAMMPRDVYWGKAQINLTARASAVQRAAVRRPLVTGHRHGLVHQHLLFAGASTRWRYAAS